MQKTVVFIALVLGGKSLVMALPYVFSNSTDDWDSYLNDGITILYTKPMRVAIRTILMKGAW